MKILIAGDFASCARLAKQIENSQRCFLRIYQILYLYVNQDNNK